MWSPTCAPDGHLDGGWLAESLANRAMVRHAAFFAAVVELKAHGPRHTVTERHDAHQLSAARARAIDGSALPAPSASRDKPSNSRLKTAGASA